MATTHRHRHNQQFEQRFSDLIFKIFYARNAFELSLDEIISGFNDRCVEIRNKQQLLTDLQSLSFIYHKGYNQFEMCLQKDDICINGAACYHFRYCRRIHFINQKLICKRSSKPGTFHCGRQQCYRYIHLHHRSMRDCILSLILYLYQNRKIEGCDVPLCEWSIAGPEFIEAYIKHYSQRYPPIPNITGSKWRKIISQYNRYYYDREQQKNELSQMNSDGCYFKLWHTVSYVNSNQQQSWKIVFNCNDDFLCKRICYDYMLNFGCPYYKYAPSYVDHGMMKYPTHYHPAFCHYFHVNRLFVVMDGKCNECETIWYQKGNGAVNMQCNKYHIKDRCLLSPSPILYLGNSLFQFDNEFARAEESYYRYHNVNLIKLNKNDFKTHNKWSNDLNKLLMDFKGQSRHNNENNNHEGGLKDIAHHLDEKIDAGFHRHNFQDIANENTKTIELICFDGNQSENVHSDVISTMSEIYDIFRDKLNVTPIDMHVIGIEKSVILNYDISDYPSFARDFANMFQIMNSRWCFNRRVTICVKLNGYNSNRRNTELIIEFVNVNTFVSVEMMRKWFEALIIKYQDLYRMKVINLMNYNGKGSFHLEDKRKRMNKKMIILFFKECNLPISELTRYCGQINGAAVKFADVSERKHYVHRMSRRFIDYKPPMIYDFLQRNREIVNLHHNQCKSHINNNNCHHNYNHNGYHNKNGLNNHNGHRNNNGHKNGVSPIASRPLTIQQRKKDNGYNNDNRHINNNGHKNRVLPIALSPLTIQERKKHNGYNNDNGHINNNGHKNRISLTASRSLTIQQREKKNGYNNNYFNYQQNEYDYDDEDDEQKNDKNNENDTTPPPTHTPRTNMNGYNNYNINHNNYSSTNYNNNYSNNNSYNNDYDGMYDYSDTSEDDDYISTPIPQRIPLHQISSSKPLSQSRPQQISRQQIHSHKLSQRHPVYQPYQESEPHKVLQPQQMPPSKQISRSSSRSKPFPQPQTVRGQRMTHKKKSRGLKEKLQNDEYINVSFILQTKHKQCGRRIPENDVFENKGTNDLCRYCLIELHSEQHQQECLFIPDWIKNGYDKPYKELSNVKMFNGHSYPPAPNHRLRFD